MLNADGNENRIKINRSNQPKKKQHLHVQHTFFEHFLPLFCTATMPFCTTFNLYGEIVIRVLTHQKFCCFIPVRFYFFTAAHFHLAGLLHFSFSHHRYEIFMFFFQRNWSPLFSVRCCSSFSVIHVSAYTHKKNIVEKDSTFVVVFSL